jgi:hypothetical protein
VEGEAMTTLAYRRALAEANRAERAALVAEVLRLDQTGAKYRDIAKAVGRSMSAISNILVSHGRRRSMPKGQAKPRSQVGLTHRRVCADCGKVEMIRSDHAHTRFCRTCGARQGVGLAPPNKGQDTGVLRTCGICGETFKVNRLRPTMGLRNGTRYRYAQFCSNACKGISMQSPGSRYSEVGKDYPCRRWGRRA